MEEKTKEQAYEEATFRELGSNPNGTRWDVIYRAMDIYADSKVQSLKAQNLNPDQWFFAKNINNSGEDGVVNVTSQKVLCICDEENSKVIISALQSKIH